MQTLKKTHTEYFKKRFQWGWILVDGLSTVSYIMFFVFYWEDCSDKIRSIHSNWEKQPVWADCCKCKLTLLLSMPLTTVCSRWSHYHTSEVPLTCHLNNVLLLKPLGTHVLSPMYSAPWPSVSLLKAHGCGERQCHHVGLLSKENMFGLIINGCSCQRINQYQCETFRENQQGSAALLQ